MRSDSHAIRNLVLDARNLLKSVCIELELGFDCEDFMLCPKCKTDRAHRSHRVGLMEHLASVAGFFPYACHGCQNRFLRYRHSTTEPGVSVNPGAEQEISKTRSIASRKRKQREILLYGVALLLFVAILYYLTREPSVGA